MAHAAWANVARALLRGLSAYHLVLAPWVGEETSEWSVRLPSVLAGVVLVPVAWILGRLVGGRPLAWRLGLAVAWSPFYVWHSREARWYPFTWLLAGIGAIFFVRALRNAAWKDLAGCLVCGLAAALTFPPAATILLLQLGWIAAARPAPGGGTARAPRHLRLARGLLLVALAAVASAWIWTALLSPALRGGPRGFGFSNVGGPRIGAVLYTPVALATGYTIGPGPLEWHMQPPRLPALPEGIAMAAGVGGLLVLLALGIRAFSDAGRRGPAAALLALGLAPPALVVAASLWSDHRFAPRHVGMSFLYLLCLAAAGTLGTGPRGRAGAVLGAGLLLLQSLSLVNLHTSARYRREDVRSAAGHVARAASPADRVLVFGGIGLPWKRYYRGQAPWETVNARPSRGWTRERVVERAREAGDLFVVRGLILGEPGEPPLLQALEEATDPIDRRLFEGVEVVRGRARAAPAGPAGDGSRGP